MATPPESQAFDSLPKFDARDFQPPAWASSSSFAWGQEKNGESSKTGYNGHNSGASGNVNSDHDLHDKEAGLSDGDDDDNEEEEWQDAKEDFIGTDPAEASFTTQELRGVLAKANELKQKGNSFFTLIPPDHKSAISTYISALDHLPAVPKKESSRKAPDLTAGGIQEVTDEEAEAIEEEEKATNGDLLLEEREREDVEGQIRECTKACWGNLAACHIAMNDDKEAVEACNKALEIDPHYVKVLQRRASANDRISTWSSLTSAQDDYNLLLKLVPSLSPQSIQARRALSNLPSRIKEQQEKEKDEMLNKLKELGNGLLGKFGLSTDMFKFDQQDGGGYNMRFER